MVGTKPIVLPSRRQLAERERTLARELTCSKAISSLARERRRGELVDRALGRAGLLAPALVELGQGETRHRVAHAGSDLDGGEKDETPLAEARMRDLEPRLRQDDIIIEDDVEVDRTWSVRLAPDAAPSSLDLEQPREQRPRSQLRDDESGRVQERRLGRPSDGTRLVRARACLDARPLEPADRLDRGIDRRLPVAFVRAEGHESARHAQLLSADGGGGGEAAWGLVPLSFPFPFPFPPFVVGAAPCAASGDPTTGSTVGCDVECLLQANRGPERA